MESQTFKEFVLKGKEMEDVYVSFSRDEQVLGLKVLVSLCKRFEMVMGISYSMTTYTLYNIKGIENFFTNLFSPGHSEVEDILDDVITRAVTYSDERKTKAQLAICLRERKTPATFQDNSELNNSIEPHSPADETKSNNIIDEITHHGKSKRKQKNPQRSLVKEKLLGKKRGRPAKKVRQVGANSKKTKLKNLSLEKTLPIINAKVTDHMVAQNSVADTGSGRSDCEDFDSEGKSSLSLNENSLYNVPVTASMSCRELDRPKLQPSLSAHKDKTQVTVWKRKRGRPRKKLMFRCEECEMCFAHDVSLRSHNIDFHGDSSRSCRYCRKEFMGKIDDFHRCRKMMKQESRECQMCIESVVNSNSTEETNQCNHSSSVKRKVLNFFCKFCDKGFVKEVSMFSHYKTHANGQFVCMKCGQLYQDYDTFTAHTAQHHKGSRFSCKWCRKQFEDEHQYETHLNTHREHKCRLCPKSCLTHKSLAKHMLAEHKERLEEKSYTCDVCGKMFARPGMLTVHMRLHTGERPVECGACQLFFRTNKALAKHRQTYTHCLRAGETAKEKGYLCQECGKSYFRKHALLRHMRYHTGEKPHMCQYCGYKCREGNNLKRHMALHFEAQRNYICEVCGSAFHAKKTLEMHHAYKHSEERNFPCPDCSLSFKAKNALRRHSKVHCLEKEHKCWCGTAFKRMYNLRRHLKSVHGTDEMLPPVRRVSTLDCSKKLPVSKTDIVDKVTPRIENIFQETLMVSGPMMSLTDTIQTVQPNMLVSHQQSSGVTSLSTNTLSSFSHLATPMSLQNPSISLQTPPISLQAQPMLDANSILRYGTSLSLSIPVPMTDNQIPANLHSQSTINIQQLQSDHHDNQEQQPTHDAVQTMTAEELAERLRYTQDTNIVYNNSGDPNNTFMQGTQPVGSANIIPQAVAYSNIIREYGGQFPFLQDGTLYQYVK